MPKISRSKQSYWPLPVYVATFSDGTLGRISFWSRSGKPIDVDRGRRLAAWAWRDDVIVPRSEAARSWRGIQTLRNVRDLVSGHVEFNGETIPDPQFAPASNVVEFPAGKPSRKPPAKTVAAQALAALERLQATFGGAFPEEMPADLADTLAALRSIAA